MVKKYKVLIFILIGLLFVYNCDTKNKYDIKEGDIVFQITSSSQCKAVQIATNSQYTHIGIVVNCNGDLKVLEALNPVRYTNFYEWINRGENSHFVLKRVKDKYANLLSKYKLYSISYVRSLLGLPYDSYFEWSDKKMYCSELVWKIYKQVYQIEIGKLKRLKDFNLDAPTVKQILKERYGNNIPLNGIVISPADIFESEILKTIYKN